MKTSATSVHLSTPSPAITPHRCKNSNNSNNSNGSLDSLSSSICQAPPIPRASSLAEGLATPLLVARSLETRPYSSDLGSEYTSESGNSNYLTPPPIQDESGDRAYGSRLPSSGSLNIAFKPTEMFRKRVKKRQSRHRRTMSLASSTERAKFHKMESHVGRSEGGNYTTVHNEPDSAGRFEPVKSFINSAGHVSKTVQTDSGDLQSWASQFKSKPADSITTRKWSSVGIGDDNALGSTPRNPSVSREQNNGEHTATSTSIQISREADIIQAVKATLTFRKAPQPHFPLTPASITLRRASTIKSDDVETAMMPTEMKIAAVKLPGHGQQEPLLSYLITPEDVDTITQLIQSSFKISKLLHNSELPVRNTNRCRVGDVDQRPRVTKVGVLPQPGVLAELATTIKEIHQAAQLPSIETGKINRLDANIKASTRAISEPSRRKDDPKVVGEGSQTSSSWISSVETIWAEESNSERIEPRTIPELQLQTIPAGKTPVKSIELMSPSERLSKIEVQDDNSPISRVFSWVFPEPKTEAKNAQTQSPTQSSLSVAKWAAEAEAVSGKRHSIPSALADIQDVFSFPPLLSRKDTSDWISPLPDITAPEFNIEAKDSDKMRDDTQTADTFSISLPSLQHSRNKVHDERATLRPKFQSLSILSSAQRSSSFLHPQIALPMNDPPKTGSAIGSCSGALRKSSTRSIRLRIDEAALEHHYHEDQESWRKPRKDSGWPSAKSASPEELDSRTVSDVSSLQYPVMKERAETSKRKEEERSSLIECLAPLLSGVGIHHSLRGSREDTSCGEECQSRGPGPWPYESRNPSTSGLDN